MLLLIKLLRKNLLFIKVLFKPSLVNQAIQKKLNNDHSSVLITFQDPQLYVQLTR